MVIGDVPQIVIEYPLVFLLGVGVGFVVSNRWKIIRRNGQQNSHGKEPD